MTTYAPQGTTRNPRNNNNNNNNSNSSLDSYRKSPIPALKKTITTKIVTPTKQASRKLLPRPVVAPPPLPDWSQARGESITADLQVYQNYPLLQCMIRCESIRKNAFQHDGLCQFDYPKGNEGWLQTLLVWRGRALSNILMPWFCVSLHAVGVILLFQLGGFDQEDIDAVVGDWATFYGLVINVMLSFLLVFRLNRAAARYWLARQMWGRLIAYGRSLTGGILTHAAHAPQLREEAIRWVAASTAATMAFIRGDKQVPELCLAGIVEDSRLAELEASNHMPIYATERVRDCLKEIFRVTAETPPGLAHAWSIQLDRLEQILNDYTLQYGGMERIRGTPLPIVYVAHLRTFLMLHLFLFPYVFGPNQGWATIPLTMITAFAFLGIEGASVEVENPFKKGHVNNLNMDALAMALIENIQEQIKQKADLEIRRQSSSDWKTSMAHEQCLPTLDTTIEE